MRTLELVLRKKWYNMIASGEKKEEYREITRYWARRILCRVKKNEFGREIGVEPLRIPDEWKDDDLLPKLIEMVRNGDVKSQKTHAILHLGYHKDRKTMRRRIASIGIGFGKESWGANPNRYYFVIRLEDAV